MRAHRAFRRARLAAGCASALLLGCARAEPVAPHPAEPVGLPIPASLALAVRVDLASLRSELGGDLARRVLVDALTPRAEPLPLLERSLERSSVVWVGLPSLDSTELPERVLVLRGHFSSLAESNGGDGWSTDDSGLARLELERGVSSGFQRVYRPRGDEVLVWASEGEAPSVESALRGGAARAPALRPPERGAVSVAASPEPLLERYAGRFPTLTERFRGVRSVEAFAEPSAGAWRADLSLQFDTPEHAADASRVVSQLRDAIAQRPCAVGALGRALSVSTFDRDLRVRAELAGTDLEAVRACVLGSGCCA